jgi:hypothetical protein
MPFITSSIVSKTFSEPYAKKASKRPLKSDGTSLVNGWWDAIEVLLSFFLGMAKHQATHSPM